MNRCGGCTTIGYCGRDYQRSDWPLHGKECQNLEAGVPMPSFTQAVMRLSRRGRKSPLPPDLDIVYYSRTKSPHILDVSLPGLFCPMATIVEHIKGRCLRTGSLPAIFLLIRGVARKW
jgi:hypothetical protein